MGELKDIKDNTPNKLLVKRLKALLKSAESGRVRSMVYSVEYNDAVCSHGWSIDPRTRDREILAEVIIMQADFVNDICIAEQDSVISRALFDRE